MKCTFHIVNWGQYWNMVIRERAYNIVEEIDFKETKIEEFNQNLGLATPENGTSENEVDNIYSREFEVVKYLHNPGLQFTESLISSLEKAGSPVIPGSKAGDLEVSIAEAAHFGLDNFLNLDECVLIETGHLNPKAPQYILAPTSRDHLVIKMISPVQGALLVYQPKKFISIRLD